MYVLFGRLILFNNLKGGDYASSSANAFSLQVEFAYALPHSSARNTASFLPLSSLRRTIFLSLELKWLDDVFLPVIVLTAL